MAEANPEVTVVGRGAFYTNEGKIERNQEPIPGAVVTIRGKNSGETFTATTDENGVVQFDTEGISDVWETSVEADGYLPSN